MMDEVDVVALNVKLDRVENNTRSNAEVQNAILARLSAVEMHLRTVTTHTGYVKDVVAKLRIESNPPGSTPPPEQWVLRCVATGEEYDEDDDEFKFFAGLVGDSNKAIWTTDWKDAERFASKDAAAEVAATLAKDGRGMPRTPAGCGGWKVWTQPVKAGRQNGPEFIDPTTRGWTQVYPVSYPASRS